MSDEAENARSRWPAVLLAVAALAWLAASVAIGVAALQDYTRLANASWHEQALVIGSVLLPLVPPLAIVVLAFVLLRRTRPDEAARLDVLQARHATARAEATRLADDIGTIDAGLDRIAGRLGTLIAEVSGLAGQLSADAARLDSAGDALTKVAGNAASAGDFLAGQLAPATSQAEKLARLLGDAGENSVRQLAAIETMLAGVWAASDDAAARHDASVASSRVLLGSLGDAAGQATQAVGEAGKQLQLTVDAALAHSGKALGATRETVAAQTASLLASVDQAQVALDDIGSTAAQAIGARLDRLLEFASLLGTRMSEQDTRSRAFLDGAERNFQVLDAKLGNSAANGNALLDALTARLEAIRDSVHVLAEPLTGTSEAMRDIEMVVGRLETAAAGVVASLGRELPATTEGLAALEAGVARLHAGSSALAGPLGDSDVATARIGAALADAHDLAQSISNEAGTTAIGATTQLIEVLGRVREIANNTAGTMRETLSAVVDEAEAALQNAGAARAQTAFAAPIRSEIAELEAAAGRAADAAQAAAERVTHRLLGLTQTIATVEARIELVDSRHQELLRDDIAKRSEALLASLRGVSIDVGKMLAIDVGDDAWLAYMKGDKGIFVRRSVKLMDRGTARQITRMFEQDVPFREQAARYVTEFETLLKHVTPGHDGKTLALTLLSSDIGKLYVALAQATEGLR